MRGGLGCVIATVLTGCLVVPHATQLSVTPGAPRPLAAEIVSYQAAVDAIVSVMTQNLQIPMPATSLTMYFYPNREAFAQGLTERYRTDPTLARDIAQTALGRLRQTADGKQLLVNEEILVDLRWPERIHVLAHELTHVAQYELAGGKLAGELWLLEGMADWVAYQVLEALGLDTFDRRKEVKLTQIKQESWPPSLADMTSTQDWQALNTRYGSALPYAQAFLATDLLIQKRGLSAVITYFQRLPQASDVSENFQAAFGTDPLTFQREFDTYLQALLG
jgi:hypothetical protein